MTADDLLTVHDCWRAYQLAHTELTRLVEELGKGLEFSFADPRIDQCQALLAALRMYSAAALVLASGPERQ